MQSVKTLLTLKIQEHIKSLLDTELVTKIDLVIQVIIPLSVIVQEEKKQVVMIIPTLEMVLVMVLMLDMVIIILQ